MTIQRQKQYLRSFKFGDGWMEVEVHAPTQVANSIRRSLLTDVPCLAPESVEVFVNTSCLPDEHIAHRIGMIPFRDERKEGKGETAFLDLDVTGRKATTDDFVVQDQEDRKKETVLPVGRTDVMTLLGDDQRLKVRVRLEVGKGGRHVRWSPVCGVGFRQRKGHVLLRVETNGQISPLHAMKEALLSLRGRVDHALSDL